jgi:hypothetical protein
MSENNAKALNNGLFANKKLIEEYDNRESEKLYLVPVYLNVDPDHDYPYETVNISARNTAFTMDVCTDTVHPSTIGYNKIADVIYSYIKYFGRLDESV